MNKFRVGDCVQGRHTGVEGIVRGAQVGPAVFDPTTGRAKQGPATYDVEYVLKEGRSTLAQAVPEAHLSRVYGP